MSPKTLSGFLDNGHGLPLADIPAVATILGTSTVVGSTVTDANGEWLFTGLPTADEYVVTLRDTAGNAVARAPWSGELREAYVRDRLDVAGKPLTLDPAAGNSLLWSATGLFVPPVPAAIDAYTKAESDLRYEPLDSAWTKSESDARYAELTDVDPFPQYVTATEGNATYLPLTGGALSGTLTIQSKAVGVSATGGNTLAWNSDGFYVAAGAVTDIWVDVLGDTMTGVLNMAANVLPTTTNTRDLGSTSLRWLKVWAQDADFTNAPTVGGAALLTATTADALFLTPAEGNAAYATAAHNHDATYVQLVGGSVMTGLLGPTTTNTRDLGTSALRWRNAYLATSLNIGTTPAATGVVRLANASLMAWRNAGNTGDLTLGVNAADALATSTHVVPTVTNTVDLGTTALRWRKLWAVDGEFTNAPTVGGVALLTATSAGALYEPLDSAYTKAEDDARFVNLAGGSVMTGLLGPTTNNTRDLGTTALRWRKLWGVDADLSGTLAVLGAATVSGLLKGQAGLDITGNAVFDTSNVSINGTLGATGLTSAQGGLAVTGAATISTTLSVNSRPVIMAGCRVRHNANQTITTATDTVLAFNTENFDTDAFHDTVTNNSRLTVPTGLPGKYRIWCLVVWDVVADVTWRAVTVRLNGATTIGRVAGPNMNSATLPLYQNLSFTWDMAAGDYVEVIVRHERGSNLNALLDGNLGPAFGLERVA